jgi:hypothetical protein
LRNRYGPTDGDGLTVPPAALSFTAVTIPAAIGRSEAGRPLPGARAGRGGRRGYTMVSLGFVGSIDCAEIAPVFRSSYMTHFYGDRYHAQDHYVRGGIAPCSGGVSSRGPGARSG